MVGCPVFGVDGIGIGTERAKISRQELIFRYPLILNCLNIKKIFRYGYQKFLIAVLIEFSLVISP